MGKKKFLQIVKAAAQPLPKGAGKSAHSYCYGEKQALNYMKKG